MLKGISKTKVNQIYAFLHQLLIAGFGFLWLFVIIRLLPQEGVGRWLLFVSSLSLADMMQHGWFQTFVVRELSQHEENRGNHKVILSTTLALSLMFTLTLSILLWTVYGITIFNGSHYVLLKDMAYWYPLYGLVMTFFNLSWWKNTGCNRFVRIFWLRLVFVLVSAIALLFFYLWHNLSFNGLATCQLMGYGIASSISILQISSDISFKAIKIKYAKMILNYGKYTVGTLMSSSLLRNADTFMIAGFLGNQAVAIYSLAQKLIEVFEVVLRSIAATALPALVKLKDDVVRFSGFLASQIFFVSVIFVPVVIILFGFSAHAIQLISGSGDYIESARILEVFLVYVLLLPADRFAGIALEAIGHPGLNLLKTLLLIVVNISGNLIVLTYFKSLTGVAAVSSIAVITGIISGYWLLKHKKAISWPKNEWATRLRALRG